MNNDVKKSSPTIELALFATTKEPLYVHLFRAIENSIELNLWENAVDSCIVLLPLDFLSLLGKDEPAQVLDQERQGVHIPVLLSRTHITLCPHTNKKE